MNLKKLFYIIFFLFGFCEGYSFQIIQPDSVAPIHIKDSLKRNEGDTNLTGFQQSRPGFGQFFYMQTTGNLGSACRTVNFWDERKEFFNAGFDQFKINEFTEAMNFDLPKAKAFSELKFINGSKKEQYFTIKHFQKLTREIAAGLDFRATHSDGFYNKQVCNLRNFNGYAAFHSTPPSTPESPEGDFEKGRSKYSLFLNYVSNKIVSQENGGLVNDTVFELAESFDSKVAGVNFNNVGNRHKTKIFFAQQRYNFFQPPNSLKGESSSIGNHLTNDSLGTKESLDSTNISRTGFYLKHAFKYSTRSVLFTADKFYSSFFDSVYYDSTATFDSVFVRDFYNEFSVHADHIAALGGQAAFFLSADHQYFNFNQQDTVSRALITDTVLRNISFKPGGSFEWENGWGVDFYFRKDFNNLNSDYYKVFASVNLTPDLPVKERRILSHPFNLRLSLEKEMRNPDFIYGFFNSNHFIWFNQFKPIDFLKAELSAEIPLDFRDTGTGYKGKRKQTLKVTADLFSVKDLTYFNEEALPQQFHSTVNVLNVDAFHSITFGKFNLINSLKYQHADKKEVVRLPDFSSYTSFFYDGIFFKRALYAQVGADVRYCTLYFADAYMPATGQFYLQNEKEIGNYAYVDVFANFRIKTFRFFLKLEHLNAGFTERVYYTVPHYPMPGRTFKFGISWQFFD